MRYSSVAAALCLSISAVAAGFAAAPGIDAPASTAPAAAAKPAAPVSGDAAARHAKRTACLKDAKTRKLVGAEKTAFLKACVAAP